MFKYQTEFAADLAQSWVAGNKESVRTKIRNIISKPQAAFIAAMVAMMLSESQSLDMGYEFTCFIHPNNK